MREWPTLDQELTRFRVAKLSDAGKSNPEISPVMAPSRASGRGGTRTGFRNMGDDSGLGRPV